MFYWLDSGAHLGQHGWWWGCPFACFRAMACSPAFVRPARLGFVGQTLAQRTRAAGAALMKWPAPAGFRAPPGGVDRRREGFYRVDVFLVCYMRAS